MPREEDHSSDERKARAAALRLLGMRAHSVHELREKLLRRGFSAETAAAAVERVRGEGYLDDRAYGAALARRQLEGKSRGKGRIAALLRSRGLDRETVEAVLDEVPAEREEVLARAAAEKLLAKGEPPLKVFRSLLRRGFSAEIARRSALGREEY